MMDIKFDDDISLSGGDIAVVDEPQASGQRARDRLLTFQGEWFLDLLFGPPYRGQVFVKNPRLDVIGALLRSEIAKSIDGNFTAFDASLNQVTRKLTVSASVETESGTATVGATV
jgi:hypothetical protein